MTVADIDFEKLFSGEVMDQPSIPEGTYTVKVVDARASEGKGNGTVFLDLEVTEGPLAGEFTQVTLWIPDGTGRNPRGSAYHFSKKTAGFKVGPEVGQAMNGGSPAPILAEVLVGQVATVELSVQGDGDFAGTNNLVSSKPADAAAAAPTKAVPAVVVADVTEAADEGLPF